MGLLDKVGEKPAGTEKPYSFASGGIDGYMKELSRPKQPLDIDESEGLDELIDLQPTETDEPLEKIKANNAVANATGSLLATAIDTGLSTIIGSFIAKGDPDDYKASPEKKDEMASALSDYVKLKGGDIPPGMALMIIIMSIYLPKGVVAFQVHKLEKEIAEKDKRIAELEKQAEKQLEESL